MRSYRRLRASLYLGKDEAGNYRPSKWFTVKAFAKKDEAERFAKGFGGKVLDFEAAFQAVHAAHHHGK